MSFATEMDRGLAERLGAEAEMYPGDHGGFGTHMEAFAAKLHEALSNG